MIDHATRFSSACVIPNKRHDVVTESVFIHWIALFGAPKKILSANGSEFNNQVFHELGELLNIEVKTTGAESPWSNGITEQHNGIIGNMVDKILHDQNCSVELPLAWAVSAKNSLTFSPPCSAIPGFIMFTTVPLYRDSRHDVMFLLLACEWLV